MFDTRNELLNLLSVSSLTLVFLDPDGQINQADMLDHNHLYMGFALSAAPATGGFTSMCSLYDDEED